MASGLAPLRELCAPALENLPPRTAFWTCQGLGGLARWWLRPEVLERAHAYDPSRPEWTDPERPRLPEQLGDCSVIFRTIAALPLLRPAFLLPLCWRAGNAHSPLLPPELVALADQVVADVGRELRDLGGWGLHPADGLGLERNPVGDGLGMPCQSGWASLAAGLIARAEGLLPCSRVWASGAWNRHGLADIHGLEEKLQLAVAWEATDFFVPIWRVGEAQEWVEGNAPRQLTIGSLGAPVSPEPRRALNAFLARFTRQPPVPEVDGPEAEQEFQQCRNYFHHLSAFKPSERAFYWSHLLPGIIRRCREKVRQGWPSLRATHCATFVSRSQELAVLVVLAVEAAHCLLLYTPDQRMQALAEECRRYLTARNVDCRLWPIDPGDNMEESIRQAVEKFACGAAPDRLVLDLKPGTKKMTYAQSRVARPGNWLFNLEATFLEDRRTDPGTEWPELWQAGS